MAKKEQAASAPEVSSLPIKQDESPLVIDLPDGQKLVVGHLSNGSVIEVATWRGTGRPDSRTSRLMLGMSSAAGAAEEAAAEAATEKSSKKKASFDYKAVIAQATALINSKIISKKSKANRPAVEKEETSAPRFIQTVSPAPVDSQDDDVEEWLNSIIAKSEARAAKPAAKSAAKPKSSSKTVKKAAPKKTVRKATSKSATRSSR